MSAKRETKNKRFYLFGIGISLLIAGVISYYASSAPDGLEKVAIDLGFIDSAKDSAVSQSALADYGVAGVENERLSVGIAGIIGVVVTGIIMMVIVRLIGKKKN
jgi:cobalt/nickel transport protein